MNYIDLIIAIIFAWGAYRGFKRGFILMVATFVALVVGIWGAAKFSGLVADYLVNSLNVSSPYMHLVAFTITFIGFVIVINIGAFLFSRLLDAIALGFMNRLLGSLFSILQMALILSVLFVILNAFNERHDFMPEEQVESSLFYKPVSNLAPSIFPFLRFEVIAREIEKLLGKTDDPLPSTARPTIIKKCLPACLNISGGQELFLRGENKPYNRRSKLARTVIRTLPGSAPG